MLFKIHILDGIKAGKITLAFRRWTKPTVRAGGSLRTAIGVLAIEDIRAIEFAEISDDEARRAGFDSRETLMTDLAKARDGTVYRIEFHLSGPDPREALRQDDQLDVHGVAALQARLALLDRSGAWTARALRLISECDGRTAGEIADSLGMEKPVLKRKIRLLKELGLTESLQSGYRLSDRGRVVYQRLFPISVNGGRQ
jgi:DNA-binding transcriptional ArsR family regulator